MKIADKKNINNETPVIIVQRFIDDETRELQETDYHYKGLRIWSTWGLHEKVAELISKYAQGSELLDLGAGTGAFTLRMHEAGFNVTASEYAKEVFSLKDKVPLISCDLNSPFSELFQQKFDVIVAMEIIEHLENARHFIRQCTSLLNENGILIITSPNNDSLIARCSFLWTGYFPWFKNSNYETDGHILPITISQFKFMFEEIGLKIIHYNSHGSYDKYSKRKIIKKIFLNVLRILLQIKGRYFKERENQVNIFIVQKEK